MRDKAVDEVTGLLFPFAYEVIFTEARTPRAISAGQLQEIAGHHAERSIVIPDAEEALEAVLAKARPEDAIFVTGSLYLVGAVAAGLETAGKGRAGVRKDLKWRAMHG